jgi:toxin ParE1/3/4
VTYGFHPAAESEHLEQVAYYELQRDGLGARYLAEVEGALQVICGAPHRYPLERAPNIRRFGLKEFPYTLIFRESSGVVQVLAVAHHRRRPGYWLARL